MDFRKLSPLFLLALTGCDAQAGTSYGGEPLLTMTGSVEIALEVEREDELIPAIAFRNGTQTNIVDVDVEGDFPAGFTLRVYEPPPEVSFQRATEEFPEEPRFAIGYVTAMRPDAPRDFDYYAPETETTQCEPDGNGGELCLREMSWCRPESDDCYIETFECPRQDAPSDECSYRSEHGDGQIRVEGEWRNFAGLSENYIVLYIESAAAPNSELAWETGQSEQGLAPGYHLFHVQEVDMEQEHDACLDDAEALAATRVNERFGTALSIGELQTSCDPSFEDCGELTEVLTAFDRSVIEAQIELDCPSGTHTLATRIADPANENISVRIGTDFKGF